MAADLRRELHELVEQLSPEDAAALLADARRLSTGRRGRDLPTLHTAPPIVTIDELRGDIFPPGEDVEEFDASIRRWRTEGSAQRDRSGWHAT
jgi:hypothetical protein